MGHDPAELKPSPEMPLWITKPWDQCGHLCDTGRDQNSCGINAVWQSPRDGLCGMRRVDTGCLSLAPKAPEQAPAFWNSCVFLVLRFGPWFPSRFVLQNVGPQPLQDTTSKALAKEVFPAFHTPLCSWAAASHWAHDGARLLLPWT